MTLNLNSENSKHPVIQAAFIHCAYFVMSPEKWIQSPLGEINIILLILQFDLLQGTQREGLFVQTEFVAVVAALLVWWMANSMRSQIME